VGYRPCGSTEGGSAPIPRAACTGVARQWRSLDQYPASTEPRRSPPGPNTCATLAAFSLAASGVLAAFPHRRDAHQRGRGLFLPRSRPRLVQIRVTGDRFRAGPPPANADAVQPKPSHRANVVVRAAATPELTLLRARPVLSALVRRPGALCVRTHGRLEAGLVLSGSLSPGIPAAAVAPCALTLTVSASAAVAGVVLAAVSGGLGVARAARRRHGPAQRAESPLRDAALNRSDCSPASLCCWPSAFNMSAADLSPRSILWRRQ